MYIFDYVPGINDRIRVNEDKRLKRKKDAYRILAGGQAVHNDP